jgi:polyphenol oxidase
MEIFRSKIFGQFPELIFGISPKTGFNRTAPFFFNMSLTVGDYEKDVWENRNHFIEELGLQKGQVAFQRQIHSDIVTFIDAPLFAGESDAMITNKKMTGLAVSTADCTPVFIYDKINKVIAGVHAGWRGTEKRIVEKVLNTLSDKYKSRTENLYAFVGPSISAANYEVGEEVASLFASGYSVLQPNGKFLLDVKKANYDMLIQFGVPEENLELSPICSFENKNMHSYRRDKQNSGRAIGIICMQDDKWNKRCFI